MLVPQTNPVRDEPSSYVKICLCSNNFAQMLATWVKKLRRVQVCSMRYGSRKPLWRVIYVVLC